MSGKRKDICLFVCLFVLLFPHSPVRYIPPVAWCRRRSRISFQQPWTVPEVLGNGRPWCTERVMLLLWESGNRCRAWLQSETCGCHEGQQWLLSKKILSVEAEETIKGRFCWQEYNLVVGVSTFISWLNNKNALVTPRNCIEASQTERNWHFSLAVDVLEQRGCE